MAGLTRSTTSNHLNGSPDPDSIEGSRSQDVLHGEGGDDSLFGSGGDDFLYGGMDSDLLVGGNGGDVLHGGNGDDTLIGGRGNDTLVDYEGSGLLLGGAGHDVISTQRARLADHSRLVIDAGSGNDTVWNDSVGLDSRAKIDLGAGDDTLRMYANKGSLIVDLGSGFDTIFVASRYGGGDGPAVIRHFDAGAGGDLIDLDSKGALTRGGLVHFHSGDDLFGEGYARLTQHGRNTWFEVDGDGGGDSFHTVLILRNVDAAELTAENLSGYEPGAPDLVI